MKVWEVDGYTCPIAP